MRIIRRGDIKKGGYHILESLVSKRTQINAIVTILISCSCNEGEGRISGVSRRRRPLLLLHQEPHEKNKKKGDIVILSDRGEGKDQRLDDNDDNNNDVFCSPSIMLKKPITKALRVQPPPL